MTPTRYFTFDQAVAFFNDELGLEVKKSWLYQQSSLGRIPFFPMGRKKVCLESDLREFVEDQRARAQHSSDQQNRPAPPRKSEAYRRREVDADIRLAVTGK